MLICNVSESGHTAAFILPNSFGALTQDSAMCVEQVAEVLEITGNPHSLEGVGTKQTRQETWNLFN